MKPLADQSTVASPSDGLASDEIVHGDSGSSGGEIDHVKLAEEVHALFSGCLMFDVKNYYGCLCYPLAGRGPMLRTAETSPQF